MTRTREQIIEIIKNAMDKANRPTTNPQEAALNAAYAERLMIQWAVEEAELVAAGLVEPEGYEERSIGRCDAQFQMELAWGVAKANFCRFTYLRKFKVRENKRTGNLERASNGVYGTFHGKTSALEVAEYMYRFLSRAIGRLAREDWEKHGGDLLWRGVTQSKHWTSFWYGAVAAINQKLEEMRGNANPDERAVILASDAGLNDWLKQLFPELKTSAWKKVKIDGRAYGSGYDAGKSVDINPALTSGK